MINLNKKIAIDTNVIIYAIEAQDIIKSEKALKILTAKPFVSNQVISETFHLLEKKFKRDKNYCINATIELFKTCNLIHNSLDVFFSAKFLMKKYQFALCDAVIVASALIENCSILYSEDMFEVLIEKQMMIVNPFIHKEI